MVNVNNIASKLQATLDRQVGKSHIYSIVAAAQSHESMVFLRAFFEGRLFDKALFERMLRWNTIFFPPRYGYGLMDFRLPRFFSLRPTPEFICHSGSTGSFAFTCPAQSIHLAGTVNQIASPAKPFFLMTELVRLAGT